MTLPTTEGISFLLRTKNCAATIDAKLNAWASALNSTGREWELLLIDEASSDGTAEKLHAAAQRMKHVRVLASPAVAGLGASLRAALPETRFDIFGFADTAYAYEPTDIKKFLHELGRKEVIYDRDFEVVLVNGSRTGVAVPAFWKWFGRCYRFSARVFLGLPLEPIPGWLGLSEHLRSWWAWVVYGNPFHDPNCGFKLMKKSLIESFPIQSDGDFAHLEVLVKTTFLTNIVADVKLAPVPTLIPHSKWNRTDRSKVFRDPQFRKAVVELDTSAPERPAHEESVAGASG